MIKDEVRVWAMKGPLALLAAVAVIVMRVMTMGSVHDPALEKSIRAHLADDLGNAVGQQLAATSDGQRDLEKLTRMADMDQIVIFSTSVSRPLPLIGGRGEVIVKVEYQLPEQPRKLEYWTFDHSMISGWTYKWPSTATSYYLNFL